MMREETVRTGTPKRFADPFLDDSVIRRSLNACAFLIVLVVAAAVIWSLLTKVAEVAKAPGAVVTSGALQIVDAQDGGLVQEVFVREGMEVKKGDPLVRFDRVRSGADLAVITANKVAMEIAIERLTAFIDNRPPDFSRFEMEYPNLVIREAGALDAQRHLLDADLMTLQQQVVGKKAQLAALDAQLPAFEDELAAVAKSRAIIQGLTDKKLASELRLAEVVEQQARLNRSYSEAKGQRLAILGQLSEFDMAMAGRRERAKAEAAEKRVEAGVQLRSLSEQVANLRDKVDNALVVAPVSGLIQSLPYPRPGMVVNPGGPIAEIVPSDEELLFEARLSPRDVGFVTKGQRAKVKIDAYDFSRFGALTGVVESVSATTVTDPRGQPYYRLRIHLDNTAFQGAENLRLQAGMTGEADVATGSKTVFQYLWKPVYNSLDLAFSER